MAKQHLQIEAEADFHLIAVSCHLKDYRFVWTLNNELKTEFIKTDFYQHYDNKLSFSRFEYQVDFSSIFVISNKSQGGYLLKKTNQIDYWIRIDDNIDSKILKNWVDQIKNINEVLALTFIKNEKQKEYFIY
jgi:hypothetical protein